MTVAATLRPARAGDLADLVALERGMGDGAWDERAVAAELTGAGRTVLVADDGGAVVAYAVLLVAGDVADLLRVVVAPIRRRAGLASALVEALVEDAGDRGCVRVLLEVAEPNAAARALYAHAGFREIDRRVGYYRGVDALVLARDVAPPADPG